MKRPRIAILGAGAGGLCMAMQLRRAGHDEFFLLERGDGFGGTWRDNTYPGAACDVPSMLYCFSFEPKVDWSRKFAPQTEILAYLNGLADKYRLREQTTFGVDVVGLRWDEARSIWVVAARDGRTFEAEVVVAAFGQLHEPRYPDLEGLADFAGEAIHTARFRHDVALDGRDVVVVGNAASAVQLIPRIAEKARSVHVFQRTPTWVALRHDRAYTRFEHWLFRAWPFVAYAVRTLQWANLDYRFPLLTKGSRLMRFFEWITRWEMRRRIPPSLREALIPDYSIGCNRFLISDDYLETYARPNVHLVTEGIARVERTGVRDASGTLHPADVLMLATGFETKAFLGRLDVQGSGGVRLSDVYRDGAFAYLGLTVPGFPNLFQLYGPNTNLAHNSILIMIEAQVGYVMACIDEMGRRGATTLALTPEAMQRFDAELQGALANLVFSEDCQSWYKNEAGRVTNNWAYDTREYVRRTAKPRFDDYTLTVPSKS